MRLDFIQLKIKKLQERQQQEMQTFQHNHQIAEKPVETRSPPQESKLPYPHKHKQAGLLQPNVKGLQFLSHSPPPGMQSPSASSADAARSIFNPKEIAEVDSHFKEFISNNPYDCYQVLLGHCSIVLVSNHPVGL